MQRILILIVSMFIVSSTSNANEQADNFARKFSPGEYTSETLKEGGFKYAYRGYNYQKCNLVLQEFRHHKVNPDRAVFMYVNVDLSTIDPEKIVVSPALEVNGIVGIEMPLRVSAQSELEQIVQAYLKFRELTSKRIDLALFEAKYKKPNRKPSFKWKIAIKQRERNRMNFEILKNGVGGHKLRNFSVTTVGSERPYVQLIESVGVPVRAKEADEFVAALKAAIVQDCS